MKNKPVYRIVFRRLLEDKEIKYLQKHGMFVHHLFPGGVWLFNKLGAFLVMRVK